MLIPFLPRQQIKTTRRIELVLSSSKLKTNLERFANASNREDRVDTQDRETGVLQQRKEEVASDT